MGRHRPPRSSHSKTGQEIKLLDNVLFCSVCAALFCSVLFALSQRESAGVRWSAMQLPFDPLGIKLALFVELVSHFDRRFHGMARFPHARPCQPVCAQCGDTFFVQ